RSGAAGSSGAIPGARWSVRSRRWRRCSWLFRDLHAVTVLAGVGGHFGDFEGAPVGKERVAADDEDDGDVGSEELGLAGEGGPGGDLLVGAVRDEAVAAAEPGVEGFLGEAVFRQAGDERFGELVGHEAEGAAVEGAE